MRGVIFSLAEHLKTKYPWGLGLDLTITLRIKKINIVGDSMFIRMFSNVHFINNNTPINTPYIMFFVIGTRMSMKSQIVGCSWELGDMSLMGEMAATFPFHN